ncbi:MAG TPA: AlkA N-terminal domain-containing protein [Woeseiaceae bacterium]|jgi:AraC family transcriptional regulator of adaptative response / DNA-3-methyladenine glycosylase II|nr:AlkA N-terminal domain-containing protein [Woeseiaceae bacterium]
MSQAATLHQQAIFERARLSRDARFDGRFFIGVRTTGIYCRPICPAVSPKSENVSFYPSAAAAAEAGYRPCLRCRPECAPGTPAWSGTSTTVRRGLRLIADGALEESSVERLAERLGVTSRHLRRLFARHVGASPLAVAHTQRLHFAKRLIDETDLPMATVAEAAGYGSVRRFNDSFRKTYGRTPRELRRRRELPLEPGSALTVRLTSRKPFDWQALLGFLEARATPGVEQVLGDAYLRTIELDGRPAVIECRSDASETLSLSLHGVATGMLFGVVQRTRELFDLDAPVAEIAGVLRADPVLRSLLRRCPGVRVPGAWDGYELLVRAILGQQVSVKAATTLAGRIAERYGQAVEVPASLAHYGKSLSLSRLFPRPSRLARARFNRIGLVAARAATIRRVAAATAAGELRFDAGARPDEVCEQLTALPGVGDWTAQYVAMRALKDPDAFPSTDLGLVRAIAGTPAELKSRAAAWRPWRAYAAMLLWGSLPSSGG